MSFLVVSILCSRSTNLEERVVSKVRQHFDYQQQLSVDTWSEFVVRGRNNCWRDAAQHHEASDGCIHRIFELSARDMRDDVTKFSDRSNG